MAHKSTSLYMAVMTCGNKYNTATLYFYSRNADFVKRWCKENYRNKFPYDHIEVTKIGEYKYTIIEPVVPFTDDETEQIEKHFMNEKLKLLGIAGAKQLAQDGVTV